MIEESICVMVIEQWYLCDLSIWLMLDKDFAKDKSEFTILIAAHTYFR